MKSRRRKNILVLMPDKHMGNLVVSIPAIRALREFYRDDRFFLVVDSGYKEIVETVDGIDELILYPRRQIQYGPLIKQAILFVKFIAGLRKIKPDMAIDLEGRELSSTLTFLSGAPLRAGAVTSRRPIFYNKKLYLPSENTHRVYKYINIVRALGCKNERISYSLTAPDHRRLSLKAKLKVHEIMLDKPIACIHPGAGKVYKLWSLEGFAEISDWLYLKGVQAVFVGGEGDVETVKKIGTMTRYPFHNTAGMLSLGELMALFERSCLFIGNDSGPMHLAGAMDLPVVGLFGPADERRWGPLTDKRVILRGRQRCPRCYGKDCHLDFQCIRDVSVEDVKRGIEVLLRNVAEVQTG